jgi:hypothetical protein
VAHLGMSGWTESKKLNWDKSDVFAGHRENAVPEVCSKSVFTKSVTAAGLPLSTRL